MPEQGTGGFVLATRFSEMVSLVMRVALKNLANPSAVRNPVVSRIPDRSCQVAYAAHD